FCGSTGACVVIVSELCLIIYGYGYENVYDDVVEMLGEPGDGILSYFGPLSPLWKFCWKYTAPIMASVIMVFTLIRGELILEIASGHYRFPDWAVAFGWFLSLLPVFFIPFFFFTNYFEWLRKERPLQTLFEIQKTLPSYTRIMSATTDDDSASVPTSQASSLSRSKSDPSVKVKDFVL
ncbi:hypothetical protein DICVIV_11594, partial [Dictyocaulus viviparus]